MGLRLKISVLAMLFALPRIGITEEFFCGLKSARLPQLSCEFSCHTNSCEKYFSDQEFSCDNYCTEKSAIRAGAEILYQCGKGATWDVLEGMIMTPVALWEGMVAQGFENSEYLKFCDDDTKCKRRLALEAAMVHPNGKIYSDMELAKIDSFDLVRKRSSIRQMAARDHAYQKKLRDWNVPLPNIDSNQTPLDEVFAFAQKLLRDQGIRWECYNAADRTEMICAAAGSILLPAGAVKLGRRLAKYLPKKTPKLEPVTSITPNVDDVYKIAVTGADGTERIKTVRFLKEDNWGLPESFKNGRVYNLVMTVESREEGYEIFRQLVTKGPEDWRADGIPALEDGKNAFTVKNKLYGQITRPDLPGGVSEPPLELEISFPREGNGPSEAKKLLTTLNKMELRKDPNALLTMDISTLGAKSEWAKYSFHNWAESLSRDELRSLRKLGDGNYRTIHGDLRNPNRKVGTEIDSLVTNADAAIARGKVNRDVTVYRADSSPEFHELWDKLAKDGLPKSEVSLRKDPAYTFTSLNRRVATSWNRVELKGKGVILEIEVPQNSSAAYFDVPGLYSSRGYTELVLPRNSDYVVTGFSQSADGQKILQVRLKPNN